MIVILNLKVQDDAEQDSLNRQMLLINDQISRFHSNFTAEEIKEAMRLYVAKKLNIKVFRLIDSIAISEILEAYNYYRHRITDEFVKGRNNLIEIQTKKENVNLTKIMNDFIKMVFSEVSEKGFCDDAWYLFKGLEENEKITKSNEEKQELYLKELNIYVPAERKRIKEYYGINHKGYLADFEKTYSNGKRNTYVKNRCRSILVSEFIKESKISIEEMQELFKPKN